MDLIFVQNRLRLSYILFHIGFEVKFIHTSFCKQLTVIGSFIADEVSKSSPINSVTSTTAHHHLEQ